MRFDAKGYQKLNIKINDGAGTNYANNFIARIEHNKAVLYDIRNIDKQRRFA